MILNISYTQPYNNDYTLNLTINGNTYTKSDFTDKQLTIQVPANTDLPWSAYYEGYGIVEYLNDTATGNRAYSYESTITGSLNINSETTWRFDLTPSSSIM